MNKIYAEISAGELVDKITILKIKKEKINKKKIKNLSDSIKTQVAKRIEIKKTEMRKLQELYYNPKSIPKEIKTQVAVQIEEKKNEIKTKVISSNTIREKNGLAYSSRNFLLSSKDKKNASNIYKLLIKKKRNLIKKKIFIKEIKRVSKPGRRIYVKATSIPKIQNGLGVAIVSTSIGIMSDNDARNKNVGGEIICKVF